MKVQALRQKTIDELKDELTALLKAQFSLRMQRATQQLSKNSEFKRVRKDIARIHTLMAEKTR